MAALTSGGQARLPNGVHAETDQYKHFERHILAQEDAQRREKGLPSLKEGTSLYTYLDLDVRAPRSLGIPTNDKC